MRATQMFGVMAVLAIAGCGGGTAAEPKKPDDRAGAWVEHANDACRRSVPSIVRAGKPIPRAVARAQRGAPGGWKTVSGHMKRQSQALAKLYAELKAIPRPPDERIRRFLYSYANLAGDSFRAVDAMLYDRQTALGYVADANAAGRDAHAIARALGTEPCTSWIAAS
jgi:hypothetical protein